MSGTNAPLESEVPARVAQYNMLLCVQRWRKISLATPQLWTGINLQDLTQDGLFTVSRTALLNLLDLWINRSKSCPISIKFSYTDLSENDRGRMVLFLPEHNGDSTYLKDVNALIDKLLSCQQRWRALSMIVLDLSSVERLLQAISNCPASPLLEHLSISTQYLGIFGEIRTYNLALSSQLRTIRILSPLIVPESNGIRLDLLTELELKFCSSMVGCLQWLDKAPNLETLKIRFFTADVEQLENETRIRRLEKLTNLQVSSFSSDSDPAAFINLLEFPSLTELFVDMNDLIDAENWTCVLDLLKRSHPPAFHAMTLLGTPMTTEQILECLRMTPKLTCFRLGTITDEILQALSTSTPKQPKSKSEAPLLPLLEALEVEDVENCSFASLVNFVSSRCKDKRLPTEESGSVIDNSKNEDTSKQMPQPLPQSNDNSNGPYKTLEIMVIPFDSDYAFISHPDVIECVEKGLDVVHRSPAFEVLPPSRVAMHLRNIGVNGPDQEGVATTD
ncbi:uncharacterized protein FOMMEDRAFT_27223 [Fomitiporia mediterranea MF3/22]|uniref:uncharacterized protein n=1 Tax=Fomitiporia mediterranea (strain MF3/22) TaxID=694068 RepID=UPI0004407D86|nr:uncharacterized protein FOMMEDRAFT_27223 [Fomitiporia mediterranea MF3/22]EJD04945.1 hypothetical protein FOMMEDRAFT_27223 [Fomitiporia mediterranea MF3/22]